jgi:predicted house-cleaning noncanonical NTP pyrophosphatase (MazG superfamily)
MSRVSNKLVRDKIPDIIKSKGETPITRILSEKEYFEELVKKLHEECVEFQEALNIEELADVQEVVLALADVISSRTELENIRRAKAEERGAFEKKIYLESVDTA